MVLGLEVRSYPGGQTFEVSWSSFEPDDERGAEANVEAGRRTAVDSLVRDNFAEHANYTEWILGCRTARAGSAQEGGR